MLFSQFLVDAALQAPGRHAYATVFQGVEVCLGDLAFDLEPKRGGVGQAAVKLLDTLLNLVGKGATVARGRDRGA